MKFSQGENTIRIISAGMLGYQHSMKTANRYINLGLCSEDETCEHCQKGYEPKQVWKWIVYDYSDKRVKILDAGPMLGNKICEIATIEGDPQEYDLKITRTGEKLKTQYPSVAKAKESQEIPEEEKKTFEFRKKRLISKFIAKKKAE